MSNDEFSVDIDFNSLLKKKKTPLKKISKPKKQKSSTFSSSINSSLSKKVIKVPNDTPIIKKKKKKSDTIRSVQRNLNGEIVYERSSSKKNRPIVDIGYIEEVSYRSIPGKLVIELDYSQKAQSQQKKGYNSKQIFFDDIQIIKKILQRFG